METIRIIAQIEQEKAEIIKDMEMSMKIIDNPYSLLSTLERLEQQVSFLDKMKEYLKNKIQSDVD
jgi:uncharacterized protein YaaN involved in tellurite resistance